MPKRCPSRNITVPSSSGLGHGPLKAVTRVRLSLGSPIIKNHPIWVVFYYCVIPEVERVEFGAVVGERNFKKREPYDAKEARSYAVGIYTLVGEV